MTNMEPNKMVNDAPVVELYCGAQVQEERGQAEGGAEHHAGGHVAARGDAGRRSSP